MVSGNKSAPGDWDVPESGDPWALCRERVDAQLADSSRGWAHHVLSQAPADGGITAVSRRCPGPRTRHNLFEDPGWCPGSRRSAPIPPPLSTNPPSHHNPQVRSDRCARRRGRLPALGDGAVEIFLAALTGETPVVQALASYQQAMIANGQAAVTESLEIAERLFNLKIL